MKNQYLEGVVDHWNPNHQCGILIGPDGARVSFDFEDFRVPLVDPQLRTVFYLYDKNAIPVEPRQGWKVLYEPNGDSNVARFWGWKEVFVKALMEAMAEKPASKIDPNLTLADVITTYGPDLGPCPDCGHPLNRHNGCECDLCDCGWEACKGCGHSEWDHSGGECQATGCHCGDPAYDVAPGMEAEPHEVQFTEGPCGHHGYE